MSVRAEAATLAAHYMMRVDQLQGEWRRRLQEHSNPRADAAAWGLIAVLPAHPTITVPVAVAATQRTRPAVANAIDQMEAAGILTNVSACTTYDDVPSTDRYAGTRTWTTQPSA
ncbi:MAG: helix-turn-helix domain-containing protein [Solirubrobacteraceae bacterium]